MEPILKIIAKEYSNRYNSLKRICFVFPNKRCGVYLKKYFAENNIRSEGLPHILTISEFMSQLARKTEAGRLVQLFTLFNAYKEIVGDNVPLDFDAFRGWGEIVLADFNIVDINLVEAKEIFKNVKDYREITSDFLTEDQKVIMKEYFGIDVVDDAGSFWKNFEDPSKISNLQQKFLTLWQILYPLHEKFIESLELKGLGTSGSIYREAVKVIGDKGKEVLPYDKIVVLGFNALNEAERSLFKRLQELEGTTGYDDYTDFIWDAGGPFLNNEKFSASKFVVSNKKHFPMPEWLVPVLDRSDPTNYPEIEIISSPSVTAQAKIVTEILKEYRVENKKRMITEAEVGLILPEESLISNILFSIPPDIGDINLTMGYSFRNTPVSSFMSLLRRLYANIRETNNGKVFYTRDLKMFFSHPYSYIIFLPEEIEALLEYINKYHKISVTSKEIKEIIITDSFLLDFPSKKKGENEIFNFISALLGNLQKKLEENPEKKEDSQDISQIKIYNEYVDSLKEAILQFKIESSPVSIMQMIDRLISSEKIGFEGEPLSGLQVMGTLETRSLDFRHVIIMSMNEGIMPRKSNSSTFLPDTLRRAYGLPPAHYTEEIFGYYFYRLISRAEKVSLIYDGRSNSGLRGSESRYLLQLRQYLPKANLKEFSWQFRLQNRQAIDASLPKTPHIFKLIDAFCSEGQERKNLSASSLNVYRECQVRFFLQNILNINSDPEREEYLDAITIGDILHNVMMQLYMPPQYQKRLLSQPLVITPEQLKRILNEPEIISNLVEMNIQEIYYGNKTGEKSIIESGVTKIVASQITELITEIVKHDLSLAPFNLYGCEISENLKIKLSSGRTVNFRFAIDRLDEITFEGEKRLRIVDYKTGTRKRKANSLEDVFDGGYGSDQIFQLFTYAWLLGKIGLKGWEDVMTEIYYVPDFIKGERGFPELDGTKVTSFRPYYQEFNQRIEKMVESIFTDSDFVQPPQSSSCTYCSFRSLCNYK